MFKIISIFIISNQSILLELCSSLTLLNTLAFIQIWSSVSDGISNSNSITNYHSPISLYLCTRKNHNLLWTVIEKEDLINQSSVSFILFMINSFQSLLIILPWRVWYPRVMEWSWFRSHSSFIQSFILSNTIDWQFSNA